MRYVLALFLLVTAYWCAAQVYHTDFEYYETGTSYEKDQWERDGFAPRWIQGSERTRIDDQTAYSGRKSLRIFYPQGQYGTEHTGTQTPLRLTPRNEYYASYRIRFSEDFSWGTTQFGGKLPGLTSGANCSGCQTCTGSNGFSARFMWRPGGQAALYLYHMDKPTACGEDHYLMYPDGEPVYFLRGEWMHIAQRVRINTGSNHDGEVEVWVNGQRVLLLQELRFVTDGSLIDNFYISTFHGGDTPNWAPAVDSYTWIDDLMVSDRYDDIAFRDCQAPDLGPDQLLCDVDDLTLTSSLTGPEYSYEWVRNGLTLSGANGASLVVDQPGQYVLILDSLGCFAKDTMEVRDFLAPDLGPDRIICVSSYEPLDPGQRGSQVEYAWYRNGQLLVHASPVLQVFQAGEYEIRMNSPQCGVASSTVTLRSGLLSVEHDTVCAYEVAYLKVNESGKFNWYDMDGVFVNQGDRFETAVEPPVVYYVSDANAFSGYVGKRSLNESARFTENRWDRQMLFTVHRKLRVESVVIYAVDNQDVVISVKKPNGDVVHSRVFNSVEAGSNRLVLAMELEPGQYAMSAEGSTGRLSISNEFDETIRFPYEVEGVITIHGANLGWINEKPYYLFFYNWEITSGNVCAPTPVEVTLDEDCVVSGTRTEERGQYLVFPNPSDDFFIMEKMGTHQLEVYTIQGKLVEKQTFADRVEFGADFEKGLYFYRLTSAGILIGSGKLSRR